MGTVKWTSIPDDRPPHGWNLDFLTPDEKASIKQVLEFARRKIVFFDINFVYVAKYHYEEDRGYTKGDIFLIADWLETYIKYLQKEPVSDGEETLKILQQARRKFIDEGILEDPNKEGPLITLDFLTLPEKKFVLDSLDFFVRTIKGADLRNKGTMARKHVLDDRDYTKSDIVVIVLALGWLKNYVGANVSFDEGEEVESILRLPELAETIKEKIKQKYKQYIS